MGVIKLFSKSNCPNCEKLKTVMRKVGHSFTIIECISLGDLAQNFKGTSFEDDIYDQGGFPVTTFLSDNESWIGNFEDSMIRFGEPLLMETQNKYSLYPITYPDVYEMYKKARASYWQPEEITLAKDMSDWKSMTNDERHFVSYILAFFSASDGIVNENININFSKEIEVPEVRAFYAFQEAIEAVHSETYSILLDKYVENTKQKTFLQNGVQTIPSVKNKAEWALKHMSDEKSFARRLLAFACVEGIYFSGSFCAIFWLKKRNLLPGLAFSNELISRDEGLHTDFACLLYNKLQHRMSYEDTELLIREAVQNEKEFIIESLPCKLIGMNDALMSEYIEFVADRLVTKLGYPKIFFTENPFDFMENISLSGKTNFFEKRVAEYAKAGVMSGDSEETFELDAEF